ncbi:MAG TPA: ABC transporter ATP-binding protein [Rhodocyclaceae bacterium]|nr:ABC transporter ATP-binding protein [Rhodocyclaceae bacterium]
MLAIRNLVYRYRDAPQAALSGVSLTAARGQVLGLLGPNGAGKTTFISHLSGLLPIQEGDISINGEALAHVRKHTPARIAVAPQDYAFYPMLTVEENLQCFAAAGRIGKSKIRQRVAACIAFAQLERFATARAEHLSGGLKRRLNLAIALLPEPELILFDEATVGVDPQSRAFILDAVKTLADKGAAVIYTSHYMEEIEAIADRVVILDHGKVLRDGTLAALLDEGAAQLQLSVDEIDHSKLADLLASFGALRSQHDNCIVTLNPGQTPGPVLAAVEAAGGRIRHAKFGHYNLEQLFMSLTQRSLRDT